jgi:glycosyltransferase involved in cell wall biosynthesis
MRSGPLTFVLPGVRPAGGIRAVFEIADHLRDDGWDTLIVVPERMPLAPRRSVAGILQRYGPRMTAGIARRIAPARDLRPAWFPLRTPIRVASGRIEAALPADGPVVATAYRTAEELLRWSGLAARGVYFVQGYETWSGPRRRVDATWRAFDRIVVTAPWLAELAGTRFGKRSVAVVTYGVDLELFAPAGERAGGTPVIGFHWDDRPVKGGENVVAALAALRGSRSFRARAFGEGARPLPPWVEFAGTLTGDGLAEFYRSLDLFVSAGRQESGPMSVAEAMASGVAVVATDVGSVRVWAGDEGCRIVPAGDPGRLADAVAALLDDVEERRRLAAAGRAAITAYPWSRTAAEFAVALRSLGVTTPD